MRKDHTFSRVISDKLLEFKGFDLIYVTIQINQAEPQKMLVATLSKNTGSLVEQEPRSIKNTDDSWEGFHVLQLAET